MMSLSTWRDAETEAMRLPRRPADHQILQLLTHLPLAPERVLENLVGLHGGASLYRRLDRLANAGLVAAIRPPVRPGNASHLWYLTDLGLATVALQRQIQVEHLARRNRLRSADLLTLLPELPNLLATYDLLAAIATMWIGPPRLLAWERPWRRRYQRPTAKAPVTVRLPASAVFDVDGEIATLLLIPDLATYPLRVFRTPLDHLLALRASQAGELPTLVVATTDVKRAAAWHGLLEDRRAAHSEASLSACIATWDNLSVTLNDLRHDLPTTSPSTPRSIQPKLLSERSVRNSARALPRIVGDALATPTAGVGESPRLGLIALAVSPTDQALIDLLGRHPFMTGERLSTVLGWTMRRALQQRDRLISMGLMRLVDDGDLDQDHAGLELVELTVDGLTICAAQHGLPLRTAVRVNGLAGGGPDRPIGTRRMLLRQLAHTLGADGVFISLIDSARRLQKTGSDDALVDWQNAAACARGRLRPDGYGMYRRNGRLYGFFVEYDRGTMSIDGYRRKFGAYVYFFTSGRFSREYDGFPTILIVTTDERAEERIAQTARSMVADANVSLPILLTCQARWEDPQNATGLLNSIWREIDAEPMERRCWLSSVRRMVSIDATSHVDSLVHNGLPAARDVGSPGTTSVATVS